MLRERLREKIDFSDSLMIGSGCFSAEETERRAGVSRSTASRATRSLSRLQPERKAPQRRNSEPA